ncbi:hypothetical protein [Haloarchaeobius sp. DFWS5]|uniref:hypothetical protein n=1 Tax=Haloarchaeobius sp. DFWS5 TaxID=3446114 RepID=UPI003EBB9026
MPTRESDGGNTRTGELGALADAFGVDTADAAAEHNDTGDSEAVGVLDDLSDRHTTDEPTDDSGGSLDRLDDALSEVEETVDPPDEPDEPATGSVDASGFDFDIHTERDTGGSAHEEFKALAAEIGGSMVDDLDMDDLTLGSSVPVSELMARKGSPSGTGHGGSRTRNRQQSSQPDIDDGGFDWGS